MSSLQTVQRNQIQAQAADPLARLPRWLRYLVGAFPAAKVSGATFMVYEDQFSDVDAELMLTAVRQAVKAHKFASFPAIGELRHLVSGLEYDTAVANRPSVNLNQMRADLVAAAYAGDIDPAEWSQLYRLFISHKRLAGAFALKRQYARLAGEELTGAGRN